MSDVDVALFAKKTPGLYARLPKLRLIIALSNRSVSRLRGAA